MKIVFMGTPDFAVPALKALIDEYGVQCVFTQPDKRKGRGKKIAYSPVKEEALKHNIEVLQPVKLKDEKEMIQNLKDLEPDFIIVVAFGQILTKEVLDIPKYGCINLHGSLLPMYRGAAPINWAIINGEKKSGNTTMLMDVGLDTGDMLLKDEVEITDNMIAGELYDILKERGAKLLIDTIKGMVDGTITPEKQTDETFYAKMLNKEMANIDWTKSATDINNLIRGLNPWPVAFTKYEDKVMKIYEAEVIGGNKKEEPGCITKVSKEGLEIACGEGSLLVKRIQFPGKKALTVREYLNGYKIEAGTTLTK